MRLTIELTPGQGALLLAAAQAEGIEAPTLAHRFVLEHLPTAALTPTGASPSSAIDAENQAAIDLLQSWLQQEATDDPEAIRRADEEVEELMRNLNANRAATGERLVFP